jgi:hypothetical protein
MNITLTLMKRIVELSLYAVLSGLERFGDDGVHVDILDFGAGGGLVGHEEAVKTVRLEEGFVHFFFEV